MLRYPLEWPAGQPRTPANARESGRFTDKSAANGNLSRARAMERLSDQIRLIDATDFVVTTALPVNQRGTPIEGRRQPTDPGVAVYFTWRKRPVVLAGDRFTSIEQNIAAIAAHLDALRGQERWGVGSLEQAFQGYLALPCATPKKPWWEVLGLSENATVEQVHAAHRALAVKHHPDKGGDPAAMAEINAARDEALEVPA